MIRIQTIMCIIVCGSCLHGSDQSNMQLNPTETTFINMMQANNAEARCQLLKQYYEDLRIRNNRHCEDAEICITTPEECDKIEQNLSMVTGTYYPNVSEYFDQGRELTYPRTTTYVNRRFLETAWCTPLILKDINRHFYGDAQQSIAVKRKYNLYPNNISSDRITSAITHLENHGEPLVNPMLAQQYVHSNPSLHLRYADVDIAMARNIDAKKLMVFCIRLGLIQQPVNTGFFSSDQLARILEEESKRTSTSETLYAYPSLIMHLLYQTKPY